MNFKEHLAKEELNEAKSYVVTNYGVVVKITGFKKGADTDKIGEEITKQLGKNLKKYVKEINIKLK